MTLTAEQKAVARRIAQIARKRGATPKEIKSAFETGLVESGLRNLAGGDADSQGWRQERASLYKNPRNLDASVNRYFDETGAVKGKYGTAGDLAAAVQRPAAQYRGRYQQRSAEAEALMRQFGGGGSAPAGGSSGGSTRTEVVTPGVDNSAARVQALQSFLANKNTDPVRLALQVRELKDTPAVTRKVHDGGSDDDSESDTPAQGHYSVEAGANRAGAGLTADMKAFLNAMTASGRSVKVTTGTNHNRMTTTGNVSDHFSGNGVDIGSSANGFPSTGGGTGDLIAAHAIKQASGKSWAESLALARKGGAYTFNRNGKRTQVIYKSSVGGNHWNHVHVGRG